MFLQPQSSAGVSSFSVLVIPCTVYWVAHLSSLRIFIMAGSLMKTSILFLAAASLSAAAPRHSHSSKHSQATSTGIASWQPSATSSSGHTAALSTGTPSSSNATSGGNGTSGNNALKPNGKKAGSAGGRAVPFWSQHLGWWYDWTPSPGDKNGVEGAAMLWGDGQNGQQDAKRWSQFSQLSAAPKYLLGFNEPDCSGADTSAHMDVDKAVSVWNEKIAPWGEKGSLLGSPSMCMQLAETWLEQFSQKKLDRMWDFTAIHVYKPDMAGVKQDIEHYWQKYNKPIWVTEFACVYDQNGFTACSDQGQINQWIKDVVDLFEGDDRVMAYGYTDGGGLNNQWLPTDNSGSKLTESGQTYLTAISKYN